MQAFDDVTANPLQANLAKKKAPDLAKRNPMIYSARGTTTVDAWVDRAPEDWERSAIEGHLGTWMEEVARIVSRGVKPGSGVDLQIDRPGTPPITELYAIQAADNTKAPGAIDQTLIRCGGSCGAPRRKADRRAIRRAPHR